MNDDLKRVLLPVVKEAQAQVARRAYWCLHPGCCRKAILSHSQQKRRALASIAQNGKVYSISDDWARRLSRILTIDDWNVEVGLTEIATASTFSGFCNAHDTKLFETIDCDDYDYRNENQIQAIYLRALSYGLSRQRMALDFRRTFMDIISGTDVNVSVHAQISAIADGYVEEIREKQLLWDSDVHHYWIPFWQNRERYGLGWCWRTIGSNIGISMSSVFSPITEKQTGHVFNEHHCLSPRPMTTFSVIPDCKVTHIVMIWPDVCYKFMDGLLRRFLSCDETVFMGLVNESVFVKSEDYCISPRMWNATNENERDYVRFTTRHEYYRGVVGRIPEIVQWAGTSQCATNVRS